MLPHPHPHPHPHPVVGVLSSAEELSQLTVSLLYELQQKGLVALGTVDMESFDKAVDIESIHTEFDHPADEWTEEKFSGWFKLMCRRRGFFTHKPASGMAVIEV